MSKYRAKSTIIDGIRFDSAMEGEYYRELCKKLSTGEIRSFERQPRFELMPAFLKGNKKCPAITYVADFDVIYADGSREIIDVKGVLTTDFKIKRLLFEAKYRWLTLKLVKGHLRKGGYVFKDCEYLKEYKEPKKAVKKKCSKCDKNVYVRGLCYRHSKEEQK